MACSIGGKRGAVDRRSRSLDRVRRARRGGSARPGGRRGDRLRLPRTQRRRQVDDDPAAAGTARAERGFRLDRRARRGERRGRRRAACGVLLDDDGLYDRLSAAQNLELFGRIAGLARDEREARAAALLEHIGLADRAHEKVAGWSLGMRKKLAVARAMLAAPPVVFLDEPTNGLDPLARRALRDDIVTLARQQGTTVFVTTHDLDDAQRMCDEVGVMVEGRLIASASPDELRGRVGSSQLSLRGVGLRDAMAAVRALPQVTEVTGTDESVEVRLAQQNAAGAPVVRAAVEAGAGIEEVIRADDSLEDAFVELIGGPGASGGA